MADPLRRLFSRLDGGPVTLTAEERRDLGDDWEALRAAGLVVETTPATVVECGACDEPHSAAVRSVRTAGLPTRWFYHCRQVGAVPVDSEELRQWAVRVPALGRGLTGRDAEERTPELVWRLGPVPVGASTRLGWLVAGWRGRTRIADAVPELLAPTAVLFVPSQMPPAAVWGTAPPVVVPLIDVLRVTGTGVELNRAALTAYLPPEPTVVVDDRPRVTLPSGTTWQDVTLVIEDHHLELRLGTVRHRAGYEDLGLADGRTGAPNAVWLTLVRLAQTGELTTGDQTKTKQATLKNNVSKLRVALKHWCGVPDDPFHPVHPLRPYRPRFRVRTPETLGLG